MRPRPRVGVAFSGGLDSTALLHATLAACGPLGVDVFGFHVHHGLQPAADGWLAACEAFCTARGIGFAARHLAGQPPRGASVEAWARDGRYAALAAMAREHGTSLVLIAHHRRDQAETFLLQALRGAGAAGLAAMPRLRHRGGVTWARPWLGVERTAIAAYAALHGLAAVDDPSNTDPRFDRSRLRTQVWPALLQAFPHAEASLVASAARAADADAVVDEIAAADVSLASQRDTLVVARWAAASPARRHAALRAWLRSVLGVPAPATLVARLLHELEGRVRGTWPAPGGTLQLRRGLLAFVADRAAPARSPQTLSLTRAGRRGVLGWHGTLVLRRVPLGGVALGDLASVELRPRLGGERFQAGPARPPRSLKKQWQSVDVPAWQRDGPLLWAGDRLVFVPGLGIDARLLAPAGVPQVAIAWEPDGPE